MSISRCLAFTLGVVALAACAAPDGPDAEAAPADEPGASASALGLEPIPLCQDVIWYEEKTDTCPPGGDGPPETTCRSKCIIDKELQLDPATGGFVCKTVSAKCMAWVCLCPSPLPGGL